MTREKDLPRSGGKVFTMFCGDCGARNPDASLFCATCFANLGYSGGRYYSLDDNFDRLREGAQSVHSGAMDLPTFSRFLYSYRSIVREALNNVDAMLIHERVFEQTFVQRHLMELGMHCFLEGIAVMEQYHGDNPETLTRGLKIVQEGSMKLAESSFIAASPAEEDDGGSFLDIVI